MNTGQVPGHLLATARTGFLSAMTGTQLPWTAIAREVAIGGSEETLVDLGAAPMPKRSTTGVTLQDYAEREKTLRAFDWDITVHITYNAVQDDRTGELEMKVRDVADNFNLHVSKLVFDAVNSGAAITADYGACYDGAAMFSASHIDNGAQYQTAQSNVNTLALDSTNFQTVYVASSTRLNDQGEQSGIVPDLLIVPPALEYTAAQLTQNRQLFGTPNNDINPYFGRMQHVVVPWLDSTAWYLASTSKRQKPIIVGMRQRPFLQNAWYDPEKPDGGWYLFKYYGRYSVAYGDWRLITQGNT